MAAWDWAEGRQGYWVASSADGTRWDPHPNNPIMTSDDEVLEAITVARHPTTGEYFGYHRRWGDESEADRAVGEAGLAGLPGRRLVAVSRSPDFENWSTPEVILRPDEEDDRWVQDPGQRSERPPPLASTSSEGSSADSRRECDAGSQRSFTGCLASPTAASSSACCRCSTWCGR